MKGATRANKGEIGMIPGSMGTPSYVVKGRGNGFSFCSCSHGAGRAMSRSEAFKRISDKDLRKSMGKVVYEHDDRVRDEAPDAYKDMKSVM
jgi:tRNA-splicing ligase RtcB